MPLSFESAKALLLEHFSPFAEYLREHSRAGDGLYSVWLRPGRSDSPIWSPKLPHIERLDLRAGDGLPTRFILVSMRPPVMFDHVDLDAEEDAQAFLDGLFPMPLAFDRDF